MTLSHMWCSVLGHNWRTKYQTRQGYHTRERERLPSRLSRENSGVKRPTAARNVVTYAHGIIKRVQVSQSFTQSVKTSKIKGPKMQTTTGREGESSYNENEWSRCLGIALK